MDNFLLAVNAVMPFIIYIGIGMLLVKLITAALRKTGVLKGLAGA